jgi:hypothetical protein
MFTNLQRLARYYSDVLTVLAENSGRALRNLNLGRRYGLVATFHCFPLPYRRFSQTQTLTLIELSPTPKQTNQLLSAMRVFVCSR